jgi:Fe2+ transport system protein FeoA
MMTKEEVAQIIAYCDENKISYNQRLSELGINPGSFYDAKRKYAPKQGDDTAGEFLQLVSG